MYAIVPTTAENIIGAVDACNQFAEGAEEEFLALFLDIPLDQAKNALTMAQQLHLCTTAHGKYLKDGPFSSYLITSDEKQRAAIFRMVLEQYVPFQTFKNRLRITGLAPKAAEQTKIVYSLTSHRDEISNTCTNLGQYCGSLLYEGAGLYRVADNDLNIPELLKLVSDLETAKQYVYSKIGSTAADFCNPVDVLEQLSISIHQLGKDKRSPVVHAANAVESFLVQIAAKHGVNITGATGINSKADRLKNANHLNIKLYNITKYLGHLRNAADHGTDTDIGAIWKISEDCSSEYVNVAITFIKSTVEFEAGKFEL